MRIIKPGQKFTYGPGPKKTGSKKGGKGKTTGQPVSVQMILNRIWGAALTPQQMRKQARQESNAAMEDAMRGIRRDYQREYEQLRREGEAYKGVQSLLAGSAPHDAIAIRAAYDAAAGNVGAINTGLISSVQGAQQQNVTAGQQSAEAAAGYNQAGQPGDIGTAAPAQHAIPSTHLGVTLPVGELSGTGIALSEGSLAKGLAYAGQAGQKVSQELAGQIQQLRDEYLMQRGDLRLKKPGLYSEALKALQEGGRGDFATLLSALTLENTAMTDLMDAQGDKAERDRKTADAIRKAKNDKRKQQIANWAARGIAADGKTPLPGYYKHPNGRILEAGTYIAGDGSVQDVPAGHKVGPGGKLIKAPASAGSSGGGTQPGGKAALSAQQSFRDDARDWVEKRINVDTTLNEPLQTPPPKAQLINQIMRIYGSPLIGQYGFTQKQLRAWATQVVNSFPAKWWKKKTPPPNTGNGNGGSYEDED